MKSRFFQTPSGIFSTEINPITLHSLQNQNVIEANISDHHPVVHNGVLFWNIMMQGKKKMKEGIISYNNGFGLDETEEQYKKRLIQAAQTIAEIVYRHPSIELIGLCEGPIHPADIAIFLQTLTKFPWMKRFFNNDQFHQSVQPEFPNWGLFMAVDKDYQVSEIKPHFIHNSAKLVNRFQLWKLTNNTSQKYVALAHLPFGGDESVTEKMNLSDIGKMYCEEISHLIKKYADKHFILCADFNLNPYLISDWKDRILDQITHHNSILWSPRASTNVTVDGVLLSQREKQKYSSLYSYPNLFRKLTLENNLFQSVKATHLEENRHKDMHLQKGYDTQFGMVPYCPKI